MVLQKNDFALLCALRQNCRQKLNVLAQKLDMGVSTVYEKIHSDAGIITKHTSLLDFAVLGFKTRFCFLCSLQVLSDKEEFCHFLLSHAHVNTMQSLLGEYDFYVETVFSTVQEASAFFDLLRVRFSLARSLSWYALDDLAQEKFLSDPHILPSVDKVSQK